MAWRVTPGSGTPYRTTEDITAARIIVSDAADDEGLSCCKVPAADSDDWLGVSMHDEDEGADAILYGNEGDEVELEVAAAVNAVGTELMIDVTAAAEGRVKPATSGKQVVAISVSVQATAGKRLTAKLCRYIKP